MISGNLEPNWLTDYDTDTGPRSAMHALGRDNPTTMSSVWSFDVYSDAKGGLLIDLDNDIVNFIRHVCPE